MPGRIRATIKRSLYAAGRSGSILFKDSASDDSTIVLLSSGRSGSTWLGSILQQLPGTRVVFEPFHAGKGNPHISEYRYTYLDPSDSQTELMENLRGIIEGRRRSIWSEQFNPWYRLLYTRRLVKLVRANLLAPWLFAALPEFKYVFLLRHPGAVVSSQLNGGWHLSSERLRDQKTLFSASDLQRFNHFGWPSEGFLSNMLFWTIENEIALRAAESAGALVVLYEQLCAEPLRELNRIERYLGAELPSLASERLNMASWSSSRELNSLSIEEKLTRWQQRVNPEQLAQMNDVLAVSSLARFYDHTAWPLTTPEVPPAAECGEDR
jgi:hypothetical protein